MARSAPAQVVPANRPMTQRPGDRPARRRSGLLSPAALLGVVVFVALVVVAGVLLARHGNESSRSQPPPTTTQRAAPDPGKPRARTHTLGLVERRTGSLQAPVQDAAAAAIGGDRALLLGGLTAADISRADIRVATPRSDRPAASLPLAVHDAAAVRLGNNVYLFGGGTNAGTQTDAIVAAPVGAGVPRGVGRLPAPSSDQAAAAIDGTAYVVGGYTGARWLDSIVAWRPGTKARVAARLPFPLRYAAVAAAGGRLVIAGGSLENGTASSAVLEFTPGRGPVRLIGRLRAPTTHAAAAALGGVVYVIGGRGATVGSATGRIVAVDPAQPSSAAGRHTRDSALRSRRRVARWEDPARGRTRRKRHRGRPGRADGRTGPSSADGPRRRHDQIAPRACTHSPPRAT